MKSFIRPWVLTESCFFDFAVIFSLAEIICARDRCHCGLEALAYLVYALIFIGWMFSLTVCYFVTYFLSVRFVSDQRQLLFVFYVTGILWFVFAHGSLFFSGAGTSKSDLVLLPFECWVLSLCFAFIVSLPLKTREGAFRKMNGIFAKTGLLTVWLEFVLSALIVGYLCLGVFNGITQKR